MLASGYRENALECDNVCKKSTQVTDGEKFIIPVRKL